jgi:predicted  nucleic acid-binding Zn-ribbon protein
MRKGGIAISQVVNATCSGCNMNIPPQMYNELQKRDSLKFCPNCERIIYWKNGDGVPAQGMSE